MLPVLLDGLNAPDEIRLTIDQRKLAFEVHISIGIRDFRHRLNEVGKRHALREPVHRHAVVEGIHNPVLITGNKAGERVANKRHPIPFRRLPFGNFVELTEQRPPDRGAAGLRDGRNRPRAHC